MPPLSSPVVQTRLSTLQILISMYPSETTLPPSTAALVEAFESGEEDGIEALESLEAELSIKIDEEREEEIGVLISLRTIDVDLENHPPNTQVAGDVEPTPQIHIRPKQPTWLSNSSYSTLLSSLSPLSLEEEGSEYILTSIEHIRESLLPLLPKEGIEESDGQGKKQEVKKDEGPEQRVWFWFPMLSTKEKRNDIVQYAEEMGLTGFVLAERFRRPLIPPDHRAFTKMTEMTHLIPKYGQYNHRGEMSEVRRLMEEWGVGEDFGAVVLNSGV
ncbi:hypothetical protein D1P53_002992 [Cryptococcus gattii VGV]|nr:hypothetical protein D1P53_002992 [Cryptococcus gattii VGV]